MPCSARLLAASWSRINVSLYARAVCNASSWGVSDVTGLAYLFSAWVG